MTGGVPSSADEFPPLLPEGRHPMSIEVLRQQCVERFPLSRTRAKIMAGLAEVIERLIQHRVVGELWVDGSFLTEKINPGDVDVVLRVPSSVYDDGTSEQKQPSESS